MERILERHETEYAILKVCAYIMNQKASEEGYAPLYEVGDTWLDFGSDWKWTTIIYGGTGHFQALNPKQWKDLTAGMDIRELKVYCERIALGQLDILQEV